MRFSTKVVALALIFAPFAVSRPSEVLPQEVTAEVHFSDLGVQRATPEELAMFNLTEPTGDMAMGNSAPFFLWTKCLTHKQAPSVGDLKSLVRQFEDTVKRIGNPYWCSLRKPPNVDWKCSTAREHVGIAWVELCSHEHRPWPCSIYRDTANWVIKNCAWASLAGGAALWGHYNGHRAVNSYGELLPYDGYRVSFYNLYQYQPEKFPNA